MTVDTLDFAGMVAGLPEQLAEAHERAAGSALSTLAGADVAQVVVGGMGGSGIAGDVLAAVGAPSLPVPVTVVKQYELPASVGPRTLVFALSYSGGSDETVALAAAAADAGARLVTVSAGGPLAELAAARRAIHVPCPPGLQPRAALGALVAPLFVGVFRAGLLREAHGWLVEAADQLATRRDQCRPEVEGAANPARELARRIGRTVPLVCGGGPLGAVAAWRWKCDVNENAKAPAFASAYPELLHNEVCGWGQHGDVTRQLVTLVELRHDHEDLRLDARIGAARELVEETLFQVLEVRAAGTGPLAQVLDLMYVGDWATTYLALANDVDPGPVAAIASLKVASPAAG